MGWWRGGCWGALDPRPALCLTSFFLPSPPHPRYTIYKYDKASHTASVGIASPKAAKLTPKGKEAAVQAVLPEGATGGARAGGDAAAQAATDDDTPSTSTSTASPTSSAAANNEGGIRIGPITLTPRGVRIGPAASSSSSSADASAATADPATPVSRREGKRTSMSDVAASAGKSTSTSLGDMAAAQRG